MERMFDKDSFKDEITSASEAEAAYRYFANNLTAFRAELAQENLSYEDTQKEIGACWANLLKACKRVGYSNKHLEDMAAKYKV